MFLCLVGGIWHHLRGIWLPRFGSKLHLSWVSITAQALGKLELTTCLAASNKNKSFCIILKLTSVWVDEEAMKILCQYRWRLDPRNNVCLWWEIHYFPCPSNTVVGNLLPWVHEDEGINNPANLQVKPNLCSTPPQHIASFHIHDVCLVWTPLKSRRSLTSLLHFWHLKPMLTLLNGFWCTCHSTKRSWNAWTDTAPFLCITKLILVMLLIAWSSPSSN